MFNPEIPQNQKKKKLKNLNTYSKYTGLAFEMVFIIMAGVFGGIKLDKIFNSKPLFTAFLSLAGVIMAIYFALKDFLRPQKK